VTCADTDDADNNTRAADDTDNAEGVLSIADRVRRADRVLKLARVLIEDRVFNMPFFPVRRGGCSRLDADIVAEMRYSACA